MTKNCLLRSIQDPYIIIWLSSVVHKCKIMISPGVFLQFFKILIFWDVSRLKRQKIDVTKSDKKLCPGQAPYLRNHTSYDCYLWYRLVKWWYLQRFFHFFKCLIFWVVSERGEQKGKKCFKVRKKLPVTFHISGTIHHMIVICGTQV